MPIDSLINTSAGIPDSIRVEHALGEKLKEYTDKNLTSVQEFLKSLGGAKDFQDVVRIQTEFMHSQLNALGEQAKGFAEAYTKPATDAGGKRG